jgi:hypothetical protein
VFAIFRAESSQLDLLTRWTWRGLLNAPFYDERTVLRRGVSAVSADDEEASVQKLLTTVPAEQKAEYGLPERFDARAADSRLALLGLASLEPLDVESGKRLEVPALIENLGVDAFRRILPLKASTGSTPANRILFAGHGPAKRQLVDRATQDGADSDVLRSHAIDAEAAVLLIEGRDNEFLSRRKSAIESSVRQIGARLAAWARSDRPSISYILARTSDSE